jgi:transposase
MYKAPLISRTSGAGLVCRLVLPCHEVFRVPEALGHGREEVEAPSEQHDRRVRGLSVHGALPRFRSQGLDKFAEADVLGSSAWGCAQGCRSRRGLGLTHFDGHPRSGVSAPRKDVQPWRGWGKKKPRPRRLFTPEFQAEIVELCQRGERSIGQVARDFDLTETAVREWVKQAERDSGARVDGGLTDRGAGELSQLRREARRLREDVEILKRATAFFAKETR